MCLLLYSVHVQECTVTRERLRELVIPSPRRELAGTEISVPILELQYLVFARGNYV